jgi:tRNA G37 N-methylase TrmD
MTPQTDLIILTPAGKRFDQPMAASLCGITASCFCMWKV